MLYNIFLQVNLTNRLKLFFSNAYLRNIYGTSKRVKTFSHKTEKTTVILLTGNTLRFFLKCNKFFVCTSSFPLLKQNLKYLSVSSYPKRSKGIIICFSEELFKNLQAEEFPFTWRKFRATLKEMYGEFFNSSMFLRFPFLSIILNFMRWRILYCLNFCFCIIICVCM